MDGVSLVLPKGEIRALIGPNGAGKTTLFNMLTGQLRPDAGEVRWKGERLSGLPPHAVWRRGVSRTFQITATFASLSALDNVRVARLSHARRTYALLARAARLEADGARALLDQVGLADQAARPAAVLAYGDQKRLELAVALANDPALLLLDEPTAGMAPGRARRADGADLGDRARARARGALHRARHGRGLLGGRSHHGAPPGAGDRRGGRRPRRPLVQRVYLGKMQRVALIRRDGGMSTSRTLRLGRDRGGLNQHLRLRSIPIGMKLFETVEEMEAIPKIRRPRSKHTTDQIVAQARQLGWTVGITMADLVGAQCGAVIGLSPRTTSGSRASAWPASGSRRRRTRAGTSMPWTACRTAVIGRWPWPR